MAQKNSTWQILRPAAHQPIRAMLRNGVPERGVKTWSRTGTVASTILHVSALYRPAG